MRAAHPGDSRGSVPAVPWTSCRRPQAEPVASALSDHPILGRSNSVVHRRFECLYLAHRHNTTRQTGPVGQSRRQVASTQTVWSGTYHFWMAQIRRKCFISYHHDDLAAVNRFIETFGPSHFIKRGITVPDDVVNSNDTDYVMARIRQLYIQDSTVTVVLVGKCTWARKFVDWEVQSSLRKPQTGLPNGLLAILLDKSTRPALPSRVKLNVDSGYAAYHHYPESNEALASWIETAYESRTSKEPSRKNPRERFTHNRTCG